MGDLAAMQNSNRAEKHRVQVWCGMYGTPAVLCALTGADAKRYESFPVDLHSSSKHRAHPDKGCRDDPLGWIPPLSLFEEGKAHGELSMQ